MKTIKQQTSKTRLASKQGSSLLGAMIFLFIGFAVSAIVLTNAVHENRMVNAQVEIERAHFAAEAGLEAAAAHIERIGSAYFPGTNTAATVMTNMVDGGSYKYTITKEGFREYSVVAEGRVNGTRRLVSVDRVRDNTFAEYALWTADFQDLWFIPGSVVEGKVHSDTRINLWGNELGGPVFKGKVTSLVPFGGGGEAHATFERGYEIPSAQGSLDEINFADMQMEALYNPDGIVFSGPTHFEFDGSDLIVSNEAYYGDSDFHRVDLGSKDLVFVKDGAQSAKVSIGGALTSSDVVAGELVSDVGLLNAQVTIFSMDDVTILDEIRYKNNPETDPLSTDMLGIVSADDIWIDIPPPLPASGQPQSTAVAFLEGAFLAAGQRHGNGNHPDAEGNIGVVGYNNRDLGPLGILDTLGSSVSEQVSPYGVFNSRTGMLISGYQGDSKFDQRFVDNPPPYYPSPQRLRFSNWRYATVD